MKEFLAKQLKSGTHFLTMTLHWPLPTLRG